MTLQRRNFLVQLLQLYTLSSFRSAVFHMCIL
uniref:Uncharacterized protein n=1 Tax=Arundo donax TaxID=35708 RepID=A0A0A9ADD4_ARUDO